MEICHGSCCKHKYLSVDTNKFKLFFIGYTFFEFNFTKLTKYVYYILLY